MAFSQFAAGVGDGRTDVRIQVAERHIGLYAGQLDQRHAAHQRRRTRPAGQRKIDQRTCRVDAVEGVGGDGEFAE